MFTKRRRSSAGSGGKSSANWKILISLVLSLTLLVALLPLRAGATVASSLKIEKTVLNPANVEDPNTSYRFALRLYNKIPDPRVFTGNAIDITYSTATIVTNSYQDIPGTVVTAGVEYGPNALLTPGTGVQTATGPEGTPYNRNLVLKPGTTYYYRAYVVSSYGHTYCGEIKSFTTPPRANPTVRTGDAGNITCNAASILFSTYSDFSGSLSQVGIEYSTSPGMSAANSTPSLTIQTSFNTSLTGLSPNTTYYYRAYVMCDGQLFYGEIKIFTTSTEPRINITGTLTFEDTDKAVQEGIRPDFVTIYLYRNGVEVNSTNVSVSNGKTWSYSFDELDAFAPDGTRYVYTVDENYFPYYAKSVNGYNIVNNLNPVEVTVNLMAGNELLATYNQWYKCGDDATVFPSSLVGYVALPPTYAILKNLTQKQTVTFYYIKNTCASTNYSGSVGFLSPALPQQGSAPGAQSLAANPPSNYRAVDMPSSEFARLSALGINLQQTGTGAYTFNLTKGQYIVINGLDDATFFTVEELGAVTAAGDVDLDPFRCDVTLADALSGQAAYPEASGYTGLGMLSHANFIYTFPEPVKQHTVSFDGNGATVQANPATKKVDDGAMVGALPTPPQRTGYQFTGWNMNRDGSGAGFTPFNVITADITVYAQWVPSTEQLYKLNFNLNAGDGTPPATQSLKEGALATIVADPVRAGYAFVSWNTAADGSGSTWVFGSTRMPAHDVTLYAQWRAVASRYYTLYFNLNGGDGTPPVAQSLRAGSLAAAVAEPVRSGYMFKGWNTAQSGNGQTWNFASSVMPERDVTLFAQWEKDGTEPGAPAVPPVDPDVPGGSGGLDVPGGSGAPTLRIGDTDIPLFGAAGSSWALLNLILAIAGVALAIVKLVRGIIGHNEEKQEEQDGETKKDRGMVFAILTAVVAIVGVIVFLLTEDMRLPMALTDVWTILMALLVVVQVVFTVFNGKKKESKKYRNYRNPVEVGGK